MLNSRQEILYRLLKKSGPLDEERLKIAYQHVIDIRGFDMNRFMEDLGTLIGEGLIDRINSESNFGGFITGLRTYTAKK